MITRVVHYWIQNPALLQHVLKECNISFRFDFFYFITRCHCRYKMKQRCNKAIILLNKSLARINKKYFLFEQMA